MSQDAGPTRGRMPHIEQVLVAAIAENGVIGRDNTLPWRMKSDLQHFRRLTMGRPLVMGRKTYLSIGKPLPGRTNIVVTRDRDFAAPGVAVTHDLETALTLARADALRRGVNAVMIVGGAEIFAQTIDAADRLEITIVHARPDGETVFPPIDAGCWRAVAQHEHPAGPDDSFPYGIVTYRRRVPENVERTQG